MKNAQKIWLITGVSGGLGRALAEEVAQTGDIVFGTLRKQDQLSAFSNLVPGKTFGILLDVNKHFEFESVLNTIISKFGRLDVLVNNAGYGLFGAIEEVSIEEARDQMETNLFGPLALTQAVIPLMRKQNSGHIIQISSMAGMRSVEGMGLYNTSKFALEGFTEALYFELKPFNVNVTLVEPGPFRTNWAGNSSVRSAKIIDDYYEISGARIAQIMGYSGNQPGDPAKAAKVIIEVVNSETPPLRLPLGPVAIDAIRAKLKWVEDDIKAWEEKSVNTSFV